MTRKSLRDIGVSRRLIPITGALRTLMRTQMDVLGLRGYRALADRTQGEVSHGSVHRIMSGQQCSVRPDTLSALAGALDIATADLYEATAGGRSPWVLPEAFDGVEMDVRPAMERALKKLLEAGGVL